MNQCRIRVSFCLTDSYKVNSIFHFNFFFSTKYKNIQNNIYNNTFSYSKYIQIKFKVWHQQCRFQNLTTHKLYKIYYLNEILSINYITKFIRETECRSLKFKGLLATVATMRHRVKMATSKSVSH